MGQSQFSSDEDYSNYILDNISAGLIVKCVSICGNIRPATEGRVINFEVNDFIGLTIKVSSTHLCSSKYHLIFVIFFLSFKVRWPNGQIQRYPAGNLQIGGYVSSIAPPKNEASSALAEEKIFEPGDRVRIKNSVTMIDIRNNVKREEVGVVSAVDLTARTIFVFFPNNREWQGPLDSLEVTDKRKGGEMISSLNIID